MLRVAEESPALRVLRHCGFQGKVLVSSKEQVIKKGTVKAHERNLRFYPGVSSLPCKGNLYSKGSFPSVPVVAACRF